MTNEEAIWRIEDHMRVHKMKEERAVYITEALKLAVNTMKKQEPKDIKSYYGLAGGPHGTCPSCVTTIPRIIGQETRFCPFCGQAVKWK